MTQSFTI